MTGHCGGGKSCVRCSAMESDQRERQALTAAARLALAQWQQRLGMAGSGALRTIPGLIAQLDQHVTQIRRVVTDRSGRMHATTLAAYADGVADAAAARGWTADETAGRGWHRASWPSLHLLAVCVLAASLEEPV